MTPAISIIIPVYNVEKYLAECLESCVIQTLHNIEIICVDDCSIDNSFLILQEYAKNDDRIKVIRHEVNKKLGAARNTGIEIATGKYIWFVDSDDFIDLHSCQILYDVAAQNNVDVLLFQASTFYDEDSGVKKYVEDFYFNDLPKNKNFNLTRKYTGGNIPVSACCYIARSEFVKKFRFREGVYYEDTDFTPILLNEAKLIRSLTFNAYNRRINPSSITQTAMTQKKYMDKLSVVSSLENYLSKHSVNKDSYLYRFYRDYMNCACYDIETSDYFEEFRNNEYYKRYRQLSVKLNKKRLCSMAKQFCKKCLKNILRHRSKILTG